MASRLPPPRCHKPKWIELFGQVEERKNLLENFPGHCVPRGGSRIPELQGENPGRKGYC